MLRLLNGTFGPHCERCILEQAKKRASKTTLAKYSSKPTTPSNQALVPYNSLLLRQNALLHSPTQLQIVPSSGRLLTHWRSYSSLRQIPKQVNSYVNPNRLFVFGGVRHFGMAGRLVGRLLKLRYLVLGAGVGGGVTLHQTFESWKDSIPDMSFLKEFLPENLEGLSQEMKRLGKNIKLPSFKEVNVDWLTKDMPTLASIKDWLDEMSQDASLYTELPDAGTYALPVVGMGMSGGASEKEVQEQRDKIEELQDEMMQVQIRYQHEVERLEKDNRELKKQLLLKEAKNGRRRRMRRSLIDMYSEVLDELSDYDSNYNTQDQLPRVVVVGDQSSGKTSVLEMIAQARIFPRGSGEMMTRSPVKVTLSEGPYHIAKFKDSQREFDLSKESELEALRREIEIRMKASVSRGQTISSDTISLTVKGPGIQRLVLVDLPGVISTVTTGMALDTKDKIQRICKQHMENPNAIILCIQDGSLDAERSNVTDLVSTMDPTGRRTIFVLTKVDLAEKTLMNPDRIKQILEGRLFPMKALGYFAVVTGKGNTNDTIQTIKQYEQDFFSNSKFFRDGVLKPSQMMTQNLSMSVSQCFWKMVKESVEQQADSFKASRFNLETEWKNTFPKVRELNIEELFEKARGEILDELIDLSQITPRQWEDAFMDKLWENMDSHVFENIYLTASQADNPGIFNTSVDIKLKQWAEKQLPKKCVDVGWKTLEEQFTTLVERDRNKKDHDDIYDKLKTAVKEQSMEKHKWDEKAQDSLRVIQNSTLEDRSVPDKHAWDGALQFMETVLKEKSLKTEDTIKEMVGPTTKEQWMYWKYRSQEQRNRGATFNELERLIHSYDRHVYKHQPNLSFEELTTVRKNLETTNVEVDDKFIRDTWHHMYRKHFIKKALDTCSECKKGFYYYQRGFSESGLDCSEVVLFWRIQRMLQVTANALRQQVMNNEARRLERNIKDVLDDIGDDRESLEKLLTGKRVQLAEELKRVRQVQELLEEFIQSLNKEKS